MSSTTTVFSIYSAFTFQANRVVGSISAVDTANDVTTVLLECAVTSYNCETGLPLIFTFGPTTFRYTETRTQQLYKHADYETSIINAYEYRFTPTPTLWGEYTLTQYAYTSLNSSLVSSYSYTGSRTIQPSENDYIYLKVTGGVDKLLPASTSVTATDSGTGGATATMTLTGPGLPSGIGAESEQDLSSGSSSKAWIAGPVIGGLVGLLLILLLAWWLRRRRYLQNIAASNDTDGQHAELEAKNIDEVAVAEMAAEERAVAELPTGNRSRDNVHEMP